MARRCGRILVLGAVLSGAGVCVAQSGLIAACTAPQATSPATGQIVTPAAKSTGKLAIEQPQLITHFDAAGNTVLLSVSNNTAGDLSAIAFSSVDFLDGKTDAMVPGWAPQTPKLIPVGKTVEDAKEDFGKLPMGQRTDCTLRLPPVDSAGTYTGVLRVTGDGFESSVPLTIKTRGPYYARWRGIPLGLMTAVFFVGWLISVGLDRWTNIELPRKQQQLVLEEAQQRLGQFAKQIAAWEQKNNALLPNGTTASNFDKLQLDALLSDFKSQPVVTLQQTAQQYALICDLYGEFYTALQIAAQKFPAAEVSAVGTALDNCRRGPDVVTYRAALLQVLTSPAPAAGPQAHGMAAGANINVDSVAAIRTEIAVMDWTKLLLTGLVVWISAYAVLYLSNPAFGTSTDYLNLFLWSLGLTTTGSQVTQGIKRG